MRPSIRALSAASASTSPRSLSTCPPSPRPPHMLPRPCCLDVDHVCQSKRRGGALAARLARRRRAWSRSASPTHRAAGLLLGSLVLRDAALVLVHLRLKSRLPQPPHSLALLRNTPLILAHPPPHKRLAHVSQLVQAGHLASQPAEVPRGMRARYQAGFSCRPQLLLPLLLPCQRLQLLSQIRALPAPASAPAVAGRPACATGTPMRAHRLSSLVMRRTQLRYLGLVRRRLAPQPLLQPPHTQPRHRPL